MSEYGCLCSSTSISLHNYPFIYGGRGRGVISLQALSDAGTQKRVAGIRGGSRSRKWRASVFTIVAPRLLSNMASRRKRGMVTYTRETCSKFSHEVSSGRLAPFLSAAPGLDSTPSPLRRHPRPGPRRRERGLLSGGPEHATRRKNAMGKTCETGRANFSGGCAAASRRGFSGH